MGLRHALAGGAVVFAGVVLLAGSAHAVGADGADIPSNVPPPPYQPPPLKDPQRPVRLDARTLLQLALAQNAEVLSARLQTTNFRRHVSGNADVLERFF